VDALSLPNPPFKSLVEWDDRSAFASKPLRCTFGVERGFESLLLR
jgi:hypothetical protein